MPKQSPHDGDEIAPGTVVDGRYRIVRPIGQGGNGMVYEVEHVRTGRKLALKALLDETGFARLEQEARAASLMKNGHAAQIVDMEANGPTGAYMVMELLEGQSLRALLDDAGQLPLELTVNIAMQVCECLHEAHGLGIIHRDLKPENVFLCRSPWPGQYDVKVLDFGVMKIAEGGGAIPKSSLTRTGSTVGTPYYMSLEQLRNSSAVDARADVYSLGVVLYECLSGRKPFQADTIGDLVYALCSGPPTQLSRLRPDLPADMAEMVMRTLSANRDDRPASMLDLAISLLGHANQAFALWVKVDGKQPALARGPLASDGGAVPTYAFDAPHAPHAPPKALAGVVGVGGAGGAAAPPRPVPKELTASGRWAPAGEKAPGETGRRDTPTEMYLKAVHGGPAEGEDDGPTAGDRDTPTRAIALDALQRAGASAADGDAAEAAATIDLRESHQVSVSLGGSLGGPAGGGPLQPSAATAKMTIPLGEFLKHLPAPSSSAPGTPTLNDTSALPDSSQLVWPPKPAWQQALDGALIRLGRYGEVQSQRFRTAPQNTQIIVIIVAGTGVILLLGFVLFLAVH